jgi:nucleoside-diphosphate-sugar epimerase
MKFIIGCGYLGQRVAQLWLANNESVTVLTRSTQRATEFRQQGLTSVVGDVTQPETLQQLATLIQPGDTLLYAVGYDRKSGHAMRQIYVDGLQHVLDQLPQHLGKLIYISSTGVYGQNTGETVNEDSPTQPTREGGQVCLAAEQLLQQHRLGSQSVILRMAGIYGPGRVPNRQDLMNQVPLPMQPDSYLNLVHVADGARAVLAAEARATTPALYVVSDNAPVQRGDYYAELARLWQTPAPIFQQPDDSQPRTRRGGADKKIDAQRLHTELQPEWHYPDYRTGLAAIIQQE